MKSKDWLDVVGGKEEAWKRFEVWMLVDVRWERHCFGRYSIPATLVVGSCSLLLTSTLAVDSSKSKWVGSPLFLILWGVGLPAFSIQNPVGFTPVSDRHHITCVCQSVPSACDLNSHGTTLFLGRFDCPDWYLLLLVHLISEYASLYLHCRWQALHTVVLLLSN